MCVVRLAVVELIAADSAVIDSTDSVIIDPVDPVDDFDLATVRAARRDPLVAEHGLPR